MKPTLKQYFALGSIWFWVIIAAAVAIYLLTAALRKNKTVRTVLPVINAALQIALIVYMLFIKATPEELFFGLLLITAAAFSSLRLGTSLTGESDSAKEDIKDGI